MKHLNLYLLENHTLLTYKKQQVAALGLYALTDKNIYHLANVVPKGQPLDIVGLFKQFIELAREELVGEERVTVHVHTRAESTTDNLVNVNMARWVMNQMHNPDWANISANVKPKGTITSLKAILTSIDCDWHGLETDMEIAERFAMDVSADSAMAMGMTHYGKTGEAFFSWVTPEKTLRAKKHKCHPLLMDKQVIDLGRPLGEGGVYYTGDSDSKKTSSKKDQHQDVTRKRASHVYFGGNNQRLRNYGASEASTRFHCTILNEPIPYLDNLFAYQRSLCKEMYGLVPEAVFRLDVAYGSGVNDLIGAGDYRGLCVSPTGNLYRSFGRRADLSYVFRPALLRFKVINYCNYAEETLRRFMAGDETLQTTDITSVFYTPEGKMNPERSNNERFTKVKGINYAGKQYTLKLLYEATIPRHRDLKALATKETRVHLVTHFIDEFVFGYMTIITHPDGATAYWSPMGCVKVLPGASKAARDVQ